MKTHAELSKCRKYRYALWRTWDNNKKKVMFIGLNPSTANENTDDRTVARCISYAKQWNYGGIIIGNLFAFRTSSPEEMMKNTHPIGKENDIWLQKIAEHADVVVGIWGNAGVFLNRSKVVAQLFPNILCLKVTGAGQPHHTRGLPDGIYPIPFIP